ncbi:hypothetical protein KC929_03215 [Patescibacteria group bacterium]|mgnify:CR=1 FL=1|nr:hypothetical protein [Patescibacteria group bacterium]
MEKPINLNFQRIKELIEFFLALKHFKLNDDHLRVDSGYIAIYLPEEYDVFQQKEPRPRTGAACLIEEKEVEGTDDHIWEVINPAGLTEERVMSILEEKKEAVKERAAKYLKNFS